MQRSFDHENAEQRAERRPELTWYASAAVDFDSHHPECTEAYSERLKDAVERFKDSDETSTVATSDVTDAQWYNEMLQSLSNADQSTEDDEECLYLSTRIRRAGDDKEAIPEGTNLPPTVSYAKVSATVARRQRAHDNAAHEANMK